MSKNTNKQILKSTSIIGGSSAINIVFKIVQSKAAAILLGPEGVGLMGLFNSVLSLAATLSGMGIATSGVREIAAAAENDNPRQLAGTVRTFQRITLILGSIGTISVFFLRNWISKITFGSPEYANAIGWLSFAVFFLIVATSQTALIQGMRRIGDLARVSVIGVAIGTIVGIPMMYWWGTQGVVFYLIGVAGTTILVSWWYARKIQIAPYKISWSETCTKSHGLLKLGITFMGAGLTTMATTYLIKVSITRNLGLEAAGLYQAASALANVYVGFILGAMGADFFPHLSSVTHDNIASNELINAQVKIGILLAVPGILAVLALGPWLLQILYSAEFTAAFNVFRWQALGTFLRVVSWPLGFLLLAREKGNLFWISEVSSNLLYLGATWFGLQSWGLTGVGIAFLVLYIFYTSLMIIIAKQLSNFQWEGDTLRQFIWIGPSIIIGFLITYIKPPLLAFSLGGGLAIVIGLLSLKSLRHLIGPEAFDALMYRIKNRFRIQK